jgi:HEAT repeat protein
MEERCSICVDTLAMIAPFVASLLPRGRALRRQQAALRKRMAAEPALQLLPGLIDVPLNQAPLPDPRAILDHTHNLALCGPVGSGRSLALLQIVARWVALEQPPPLLFLPLSTIDAQNLSPRAVITGQIHQAGFGARLQSQAALLLIDEWEELPADRRQLWQSFLNRLSNHWPQARAVVTLPEHADWHGFDQQHLGQLNQATSDAWLALLLASYDQHAIHADLERPALTDLRYNPRDLLLFTTIYPIAGAPASLPDLYEQAVALSRSLIEDAPALTVGRGSLRHYHMARTLVETPIDPDLFTIEPIDQEPVLTLAVDMTEDPRHLLANLTRTGTHLRVDAQHLPLLVHTLRHRPDALPEVSLDLLDYVIRQTRSDLITELAPALPNLLAAAADQDPERSLVLLQQLAHLPTLEGTPCRQLLQNLIDLTRAPATLRWSAVDLLIEHGWMPDTTEPPAPDRLAQTARTYIAIALGSPTRAQLSATTIATEIKHLLADPETIERGQTAARTLLADPQAPSALRLQAIQAIPYDDEGIASLLRAALADDIQLRQTALQALQKLSPQTALANLMQMMRDPAADASTRRAVLAAIARLPQGHTGLAHCILDDNLTIESRYNALQLLLRRPRAAAVILPRLARIQRLPTLLQALVQRALGQHATSQALPPVAETALNQAAPLLIRHNALISLGQLSRHKQLHTPAIKALLAFLKRRPIEDTLIIAALTALAESRSGAAIPTIGMLLTPDLPDNLRRAWLELAPDLAHTPVAQWLELSLPPNLRLTLTQALAAGTTGADRPGSLEELVRYQAEQIGMAAIQALLRLAENRNDLRPGILVLLQQSFVTNRLQALVRPFMTAVGVCAGASASSIIAELADDQRLNDEQRMAAIETLGQLAPLTVLNQRLMQGHDDPFMQSALIDAIGTRSDPTIVPALRQIAEQRGGSDYQRCTAALALGRIADPTARDTLVRLLTDHTSSEQLCIAAGEALPPDLSPATCRSLRELLNHKHIEPRLAAALIGALGRSNDHEARPILLRMIQSDQALIAVAAIEALVTMNDTSVAPNLVGIAQYGRHSAGVRLSAAAALLQLCGNEYLPLLNEFLQSPLLPLRLEAHRILAQHAPTDPRLNLVPGNQAEPLILRLWALEHMEAQGQSGAIALRMADDPNEELQLRLAAVRLLATVAQPTAVDVLTTTTDDPVPILVRESIVALAALSTQSGFVADQAQHILTQLAATAAETPAGLWAAESLLATTFAGEAGQ